MRYFTRIRDNPEASDYMRPKSLHRLNRSPGTIITQRWDKREKKWVDDPNLIAFTGIGGADDFREIDKRTANNLLRSWGIKEIPESAIQRHGKHSGQEGRPGEQGGSQEGFTHNGNGGAPVEEDSDTPRHLVPGLSRDDRIDAIRDFIRPMKNELGFVIDSEGNIVASEQGGVDEIVWLEDSLHEIEVAKLSGAENLTLIHNHPGGRGISYQDVSFTYVRGLDEVWAISATEKKSFRVSLGEALKSTRTGDEARRRFDYWNDNLGSILRESDREIYSQLQPKVASGAMTHRQADLEHYISVWNLIESKIPDLIDFEVINK